MYSQFLIFLYSRAKVFLFADKHCQPVAVLPEHYNATVSKVDLSKAVSYIQPMLTIQQDPNVGNNHITILTN